MIRCVQEEAKTQEFLSNICVGMRKLLHNRSSNSHQSGTGGKDKISVATKRNLEKRLVCMTTDLVFVTLP